MPSLKRFDHVGVTVADLDGAIRFFEKLGLELMGRTFVEGDFIDTVCGMTGAKSEIAMMRVPTEGSVSDGDEAPGSPGTTIELARFVRPEHVQGTPLAPANTLGIRNIAFEVTGLRDIIAQLADDGYELIGGVGEYEGTWRMAYVRGPEGMTVALAERVDSLKGETIEPRP